VAKQSTFSFFIVKLQNVTCLFSFICPIAPNTLNTPTLWQSLDQKSGAFFHSLTLLTRLVRRLGDNYKRVASNYGELPVHNSHHQHEIRFIIRGYLGFEGFNQGIGDAKPIRHEVHRNQNER